MLHLVEQLVKLVLNLAHKSMAIMILNIMVVVVVMMVFVMKCEVSIIRVVRNMVINFWAPDSVMITFPVIRAMLDAMNIMVSVNMLRIVLTRIFICVVVTHVMSTLWLNIMVLAMLLPSEMAIIV